MGKQIITKDKKILIVNIQAKFEVNDLEELHSSTEVVNSAIDSLTGYGEVTRKDFEVQTIEKEITGLTDD